MARDATWTNSDGLVVGFGTHTSDNGVAAVSGTGSRKQLRMEIDLTGLADAFAATNRLPQEVIIPRGSAIRGAWLRVLTAAVSAGGGTLDVGTWGTNDSADDPNGLVDAVTVAELTSIGEIHVCDGAMINASGQVAVGVTSLSDVVIAPSYDTAVFTAGLIELVVEYDEPAGSAGDALAAV
jgi:hypothetical protein